MTKRAMFLVAILTVLNFGLAANADEQPLSAESKAKIGDGAPANAMPSDEEDVDKILTNNLMRAQSGSKSRYSISNSINYNGGTVDTPLNARRPNITAGTGNTNFAAVTDSLAGKFSIDTTDAVLAGFGARMITPLSGLNIPQGYNGNKYDAYDPYLEFQHVSRWDGIQSVLTAGPKLTTQVNLTREGYVGNFLVQQNNVYEIANSGFSVGILADVIYAAYNSESAPYLASESDYSFGVQPFIEYQITPKINVRSYWGLWVYEHIRNEPRAMTFQQDEISQSVGIGISVIRDVFLYPNISFIPQNIRGDLTNVALSANINLF